MTKTKFTNMEYDMSNRQVRDKQFPYVIDFQGPLKYEEFFKWYQRNLTLIEDQLLTTGVVFIRGAGLMTLEAFDEFISNHTQGARTFLDGNAPRSKYTSKVYNASEYDPKDKIKLHTEFSYSNQWPDKIFFCCQQKALTGGETQVGSCREVLKLLDKDLIEEFEHKQITYIRNLHDGSGFGPRWQDAFESDDKKFIEAYCKENGIEVKWKNGGDAKFTQTRPATRLHPRTQEKIWFNQVDQFFPQSYGSEIYEALMMMCDHQVEELPMYATFGDGTPISLEAIQEILRVLEQAEVFEPWQQGDLMIVDNMMALHGRMPYEGERKVLVSLV